MKKNVVIALLLLLMFGCSKSPQDQSISEFDAGIRHLNEFAWDEAMEAFSESSRSDSTSPKGLYGEGLFFERKLQYLDALDIFMALTQFHPEFAEGHAGMSRMLSRVGFYDEAVLEAVDYIKHANNSQATVAFWADALIASGESGRARRELFKAFEGGSIPSEMQLIIACTFLKEQKQDSAKVYLALAYENFEPSSNFYRRSADYFELAGMTDSAIVLSHLAIKSSDNDFDHLLLHFERCLRSNYFYDARKVITSLIERGAGDDIRRAMETVYFLGTNERTRAYRESERLRAFNDKLVQPVYYEIQVNAAFKNGMGVSQESEILRRTLKLKEYNSNFRAYVEYLLFIILSRQDDPMRILKYLDNLPAAMSRKSETVLAHVHMLFDSGQREEAVSILEDLYKLHRTSASWLVDIGDLYLNSNSRHTEWKKTEEFYQLALEIKKKDQKAFMRLVNMYRLVNETENAVKVFDEYPEFAGDNTEFAVLKSQCLVENGQFEAGLKLFKESIPRRKGDRKAYEEIMEQLDLKDKQTELLDLVEFCLELNPENVDMLLLAAKAYSERGQFERGEELALEAFDLEPENVFCAVQQAVAMYGQNQVEDAIKLLEEIYEANRFVSDISYHLARILSLEERDPLRAANLARISVGMSYMSYQTWVNLCFAYYQGGRFDLARGEAIKASHKFKNRPLPFYWLGKTKFREGNKEAKEEFLKAIDLGLRNEELADAKKILAQLSK